MKRDLVDAECREVVANIVVAVAVLATKIARQGRDDAKAGEGEKAAVRDLIETVAVGVVAVQREAGKLFRDAGLKAGVVAAGSSAELVDVTEARVERLVVGERRKAAIADVLIAVELYLVGLADGAGPHIIHAEGAVGAQLSLDAEAPLQEVGRLQFSAREGVEIDGQGACWRVRGHSRTGIAVGLEGCSETIDLPARLHRQRCPALPARCRSRRPDR